MKPQKRRTIARVGMKASILAGITNLGGFYGGLISHATMDSVTNALSWLALTLTLWDVAETTDAHVKMETKSTSRPKAKQS